MSQIDLVKIHLRSGKSITPLEALHQYGSFRLGSIIYRLRHAGMDIKTELVGSPAGGEYAKYSLVPKEDLFAQV